MVYVYYLPIGSDGQQTAQSSAERSTLPAKTKKQFYFHGRRKRDCEKMKFHFFTVPSCYIVKK